MNYAALKAEVELPAYAGMTDEEIAEALKAQIVQVARDVPTNEAKNILRLSGEWGAIVLLSRQTVALDAPEAQAVVTAITVVDTLTETTVLGTTDETHWLAMQNMVGALRQSGVISVATRDALLALRTVSMSRAAQLGFPALNDQEIKAARASNG